VPVSSENIDFQRIFNNITRSIKDRLYNEYELHGYLPIDVLPFKGKTDFVKGSTLSCGCKREFPENEFSNTQIRKGAQIWADNRVVHIRCTAYLL
jgi:hypothetical protein